jgi:hypothetical protein
MEFLPTLRVWHWLHAYPPRYKLEGFLRVLQMKPSTRKLSFLNSVVFWMVANVILTVWIGQIGYWLMPIIITILSLHYALKITQEIIKQRKNNTFDLLSLYGGGEPAAVSIARASHYPRDGRIYDVTPALIFVSMISYCAWTLPLNITSPLEVIFTTMVVVGGLRFIDYLQSFVMAALIALLVSQQADDMEASVRLIAWFLFLQVICYVGFGLLLSLLFSTEIPDAVEHFSAFKIAYILNFIVQTIVLIVFREFINLVLWQMVKRRLEA